MPLRITFRLTPSERDALKRQRRLVQSAKVRDRITALLMLASGMLISEVMDLLSISRATLANWRNRWMKHRFFGLTDAPRSGRPPEVTAKYIALLVKVVERDPRDLGYAFTRWTAPRLAQYMGEEMGIWVSPPWVTEILRMHGFVWRRTKRTIRNLQNRFATKRAQKALRRLKKGLSIRTPITNSGLPTGLASTSCP